MGAGIAYVDGARRPRGRARSTATWRPPRRARPIRTSSMTDQIMKGRAKTADRDALLARITPTADYADLKDVRPRRSRRCSRIRKVKAEVIAKVEAAIRPGRDLRLQHLDPADLRPRQDARSARTEFIGIHFFSPVEKMMLVEIIMGEETGDKALATALDYVRAIKKTPIVVNDARGFFANRCVARLYPRRPPDAGRGRAAGDDRERRPAWPACRSGRCRSTTRSAIDLALQDPEGDQGAARRRRRSIPAQEAAARRDGREARAASAARTARASTTIRRAGRSGCGRASRSCRRTQLDPDALDIEELKQRLLVTQALEAARTVEEGVVTDPREADVGSILGFGFAPYHRRRAVLHRLHGREGLRRAVRALAGAIRRPLRAAEDPRSTWPRTARPSTAAAGRRRRRRRSALTVSFRGDPKEREPVDALARTERTGPRLPGGAGSLAVTSRPTGPARSPPLASPADPECKKGATS